MKTKDLIKILPIEEGLKIQILNMYDYMELEQKLYIGRLVWNSYYILHQQQLNLNLATQYKRVMDGEDQFTDDFFERALVQTDKDFKKLNQKSLENVDLAEAKRAMEKIIREINDAKNTPAAKKN